MYDKFKNVVKQINEYANALNENKKVSSVIKFTTLKLNRPKITAMPAIC